MGAVSLVGPKKGPGLEQECVCAAHHHRLSILIVLLCHLELFVARCQLIKSLISSKRPRNTITTATRAYPWSGRGSSRGAYPTVHYSAILE